MLAIVLTPLLLLLSVFPAGANAADADRLPVFDLHFAVITKNADAHGVATLAQLKREVDILNTYFVTEDRKPLVTFRFKSAAFYDETRQSRCELVGLGDADVPYDSTRLAELFNACDDPKVRDPQAINIYVYDSHNARGGRADTTGHGKRNSNRPFILLDWERLDHRDQSPEEHEMGHAFGLGHECAPGAKRGTSTNIMASAECGRGSAGRRDIGFSPAQARTILDYARKIQERLRRE